MAAVHPEAVEESLPLTAVVAYAGLTVVIIVAILLVMRALGQKPLVVVYPNTQAQSGWTSVTDHEQQFTFELPPQWQWVDRQDRQQAVAFEEILTQHPAFQAALSPLGSIAPDTEPLVIAASQIPADTAAAAFVIVAHSTRLYRLSPEEAITLSIQETPQLNILEAEVVQNFTGEAVATLVLELSMDEDTFRCHQAFIRGQGDAFLVAGCARQRRYGIHANNIQNILASFQPLSY